MPNECATAPQGSHSLPCSPERPISPKLCWACPHCDHFLMYRAQDRDVAELAANSHVCRQHRETKTIVLLPSLDDDLLPK